MTSAKGFEAFWCTWRSRVSVSFAGFTGSLKAPFASAPAAEAAPARAFSFSALARSAAASSAARRAQPVGRGLGLERDGGGEALGGGALEPRVDVVVNIVAGFEVVEVRGAELPSVAAGVGGGGRRGGAGGEGQRRERGRDGTGRREGSETGEMQRRGSGRRVFAHLSSISNAMADASPRERREELLLQRLSAAFQSGDARAARPVEMHARPILPSAPPRVIVRHPGVRRVRVVAAGVRARVPRRRASASPVFSTLTFSSSSARHVEGNVGIAGPRSVEGLKFPIVPKRRFFFQGDIFTFSRCARREARSARRRTSARRRRVRGSSVFEGVYRGGSTHPSRFIFCFHDKKRATRLKMFIPAPTSTRDGSAREPAASELGACVRLVHLLDLGAGRGAGALGAGVAAHAAHVRAAPPAPWYILEMMGLQMPSSSFCLSSNSSTSAVWLPSSQVMVSSTAAMILALSSASILPPTFSSFMVFFML